MEDRHMGIVFIWSDEYTVGNEELDNQHRYMFDLGNKIQSAKPSEARAYVMALYKYVTAHFTKEEEHMKSMGFPGIAEHQIIHENLITTLNDLAQGFQPEMLNELITFLHNWLINHILNDDKQYFDFVHSRI